MTEPKEHFSIDLNVKVVPTARTLQLSSMFDIPASERSAVHFDVHMPLSEKPWQIGLIVGPSGCGKSTIARELFHSAVVSGYKWSRNHSVLDDFPFAMSIKDVSKLLGAVGFNSPPSWMRPYHVLSTGEQFRVTIARALSEEKQLICIDEFTSVVDRQVAQIASHSVQKAVRKSKKQLVALSCHYDVIDWLQPDWIYEPQLDRFQWRSLQRRPALDFAIYETDRSLWPLFAQHHYLSADLSPASKCFAGYLNGTLAAFNAYIHFPHPRNKRIKLSHRLVVLPDFQGLGLGGLFNDWLGERLYAQGFELHCAIAHPALLHHYAQSPRWELMRTGRMQPAGKNAKPSLGNHANKLSCQRVTSTFVYRAKKEVST